LDLLSNVLTWDATMSDIYGIAPTASIPYGQWAGAVHPDDLPAAENALRSVIEQKGQGSCEFRIVLGDRAVKHVAAVQGVVLDSSGKALRVIGVNMDISERKELDRIKSEFIATVSHELRTPLTSIRGSLGLVSGGAAGVLPEQAARLVDVAYRNTDRLTRIVNDILDAEKLGCGQMSLELTRQSLAALVEQAVEENHGYSRSYQVRFVILAPLPQAMVMVDANRILQVLANFLSNAAKFSPADATVDIGMAVDGTNVRVSVTDHGPGVPAAFRDRIFERFSQADNSDSRRKGGTGLGLTIAKALIERMQGTIGYTTHAGSGTTFFFDLPVSGTN